MDEVTLEHVSYTYRVKNRDLVAIRDIDLTIRSGEIVAIVGPSGAGKTTLLRLIAGLMRPTAGKITIGGAAAVTARLLGRLAVVFQQPALLPWRSVYDNVALPLELAGRCDDASVIDALRVVGLDHFREAYPHQLSGGMQSRTALARAFIMRPELLLLDEPFGSLDELTAERLNTELLTTWREVPKTIIIVTHSVQQAVTLANRVVVLSSRPGAIVDIVDVMTEKRLPIGEVIGAPAFRHAVAAVREALWRGAEAQSV